MERTGIPQKLADGGYQDLLAQKLMQQGQQSQVYSPTQGMSNIIQALMGAYMMKNKGLPPTNIQAPGPGAPLPQLNQMQPIAPPNLQQV